MQPFEKLETIRPLAVSFKAELAELAFMPQDEQLDYILPFLNRLTNYELNYSSWPKEFIFRNKELVENLYQLKQAHNKIIHSDLNYEESMRILADLYDYGLDIDWQIGLAIRSLS